MSSNWIPIMCISVVSVVVTIFVIAGHDLYVSSENNKQDFRNNLHTTDSCVLIKELLPNENGYWFHSTTYNMVQERLTELKC